MVHSLLVAAFQCSQFSYYCIFSFNASLIMCLYISGTPLKPSSPRSSPTNQTSGATASLSGRYSHTERTPRFRTSKTLHFTKRFRGASDSVSPMTVPASFTRSCACAGRYSRSTGRTSRGSLSCSHSIITSVREEKSKERCCFFVFKRIAYM